MAKIQTAVQALRFTIPAESTRSYIDLSQCASIVNRRFYRQGLNYAVGGFTIVAPAVLADGKTVTIEKLPNTWMCSNAWHKTYAAWQKQQREAIDEAGAESMVAKFRDFKIFMDGFHASDTFVGNLIPIDAADNPYLLGEWESTEVVIPNEGGVAGNTVKRKLHMVGVDNGTTSFGMIANYQLSRAYPQSPDPAQPLNPQVSFFSEMIDVGETQTDVLDAAVDINNDLPYDQQSYPGGATQAPTLEYHIEWVSPANNIQRSYNLPGGNFPCGLIKINTVIDAPINLIVHLVPGGSRGYLTQAMQDM